MTAIPTAATELEEFLNDTGKMSALFDNGKATPQLGEFLRNYATAHNRRDAEFGEQIREQVQATMQEFLRDAPSGRVPLSASAAPGSPSAPGSRVDGIYADHGEFLQAVYDKHDRLTTLDREDISNKLTKHRSVQNSYGTSIPADGGFLVPESMRQDILTVALETSIVRPRATVIPMTTGSVSVPATDDTTHAGGTAFGGVTTYWTAEAAQMTETQGKFGRVKLESDKLTAFSLVPNDMIEDAPAFLAWFRTAMPQAVAFKEDYSFTNGSGAGEPLGWRNAAATVSVTRETGQASGGDPGLNTIVWENLVKAYSRMLPGSLGRAVWIVSPDSFPELATMALSVGTGGSAIWLNNGASGPPMTILGRPVLVSEKVGTVGSAGDVNFVDLSYYGIGDRMTMTLASSTEYKFQNDETAFRLIERTDGRPLLLSSITPANGGAAQSAFVNIAQRTS